MTTAIVRAASLACLTITTCLFHSAGSAMTDTVPKTALYQITDKRPDGACTWATLMPLRTRGAPIRVLFCNPKDIDYLDNATPRFRMATLLDKNGPAARLLPVTIGLNVSIEASSPTGDTPIIALPRPSPLRLPAGTGALREVIAAAARHHQPVAFALSDWETVIDAAPIDPQTAHAMLGMQPKR